MFGELVKAAVMIVPAIVNFFNDEEKNDLRHAKDIMMQERDIAIDERDMAMYERDTAIKNAKRLKLLLWFVVCLVIGVCIIQPGLLI